MEDSLSARQTKRSDEKPNGSAGASTAGAGALERSDDDPRLAQPRARRIAPSNPSVPDAIDAP